LLIVFFSGGQFFDVFPIGGFVSDAYEDLNFWGQVWDRVHHAILPLTCYVIGSFTTLTMLMKNSLLEEIKKDYIRTARAKGLSERAVYLKHALRNALIPIATGIGAFLGIFFAGSILLETIFQLDGMGLLSYQATLERDYNVIMGLLFIQSMFMLLGNLISDITYVFVDPRIDFS
jgi:microcin C transport system permease protein